MYSKIKWQISIMQNRNYFCTNLIYPRTLCCSLYPESRPSCYCFLTSVKFMTRHWNTEYGNHAWPLPKPRHPKGDYTLTSLRLHFSLGRCIINWEWWIPHQLTIFRTCLKELTLRTCHANNNHCIPFFYPLRLLCILKAFSTFSFYFSGF